MEFASTPARVLVDTMRPRVQTPSWGNTLLRWPDRILGPPPGLKEINLACWGLFVAFLIAPLCVVLWSHLRTGSGSIRQLHSDFVYFFGVGHIANEYGPHRIYDAGLQLREFTQLYPLSDGTYGPSPYPPFVVLFFSLFARIPFEAAYLLWALISLTLYGVGIATVTCTVFPHDPQKLSLALCGALAFYPFCFDTLLNGQLASLAVFSAGLAISEDLRDRAIGSGLALSILAYKPTLLVLLPPMLLVTRRFKTLAGFVVGVAAQVLLATGWAGIQIWPVYAQFLNTFRTISGSNGHSALHLWQFIDFRSLSYMLPRSQSTMGLGILIGANCAIVVILGVLWERSGNRGGSTRRLLWASTLTWTLLANLYVPIYDSVLVVLSAVLTIGALSEAKSIIDRKWIILVLIVIFLSARITEAFARSHGIQLLSISLATLGIVQLFLLHEALTAGNLASRPKVELA